MAGNKKPRKPAQPRDIGRMLAHAKAAREHRYAKKNARRRAHDRLPLGHPINQHRIERSFKPIEQSLADQERDGSLLFDEDNNAVLYDAEAKTWIPVVPALLNMTHMFDQVGERFNWPPQPPGLRAFAFKLQREALLDATDIADARATTAWMRAQVATVSAADWTAIFEQECAADEAALALKEAA